jgi:hypothetical protein
MEATSDAPSQNIGEQMKFDPGMANNISQQAASDAEQKPPQG